MCTKFAEFNTTLYNAACYGLRHHLSRWGHGPLWATKIIQGATGKNCVKGWKSAHSMILGAIRLDGYGHRKETRLEGATVRRG